MAFAVEEIELIVSVRDDSNTVSDTRVYFDPAVPANLVYANLVAYANALAAAIAGVSDGKVADWTINIASFDPAAVEDATFASSNVERKAKIKFRAGRELVEMLLPSPLATLINTSDYIDIAAGVMSALVDLIVTGDGTVAPASRKSYTDITSADEAYQYHTYSHKQPRKKIG